ncbi:MAG: RsmE family RNA methyltransferase [Bacteroidota bacterium]
MQIFFLDRLAPPYAWLSESESHHCRKVLRHQPGDHLTTVDGKGNMYLAELLPESGKAAKLQLLEHHPAWGEHGKTLHLAVSPLRLKDRFEWLIEKAVELGATDISPIACARTDPYKSKFKVARLEKLILTAMKQCKRSLLPRLHPMVPFQDWLTTHESLPTYLAWCEADAHLKTAFPSLAKQTELALMIGPEGDFSPEEIEVAQRHSPGPP